MYFLGAQCLVSLCDGPRVMGYMIPLYSTLTVQKPPTGSLKPMHIPGPLDLLTLPKSEAAHVTCRQCVRFMPAGPHCPQLSFLLTTNPSNGLAVLLPSTPWPHMHGRTPQYASRIHSNLITECSLITPPCGIIADYIFPLFSLILLTIFVAYLSVPRMYKYCPAPH